MDCKRGYRDKEGSFCTLTLKWPFIIGLRFLGFHVRSKTLQPCAAERDDAMSQIGQTCLPF